MTFPVYQCREWQCRYVFQDGKCCGLLILHRGDHAPACGHGWHFGGPCNEPPPAEDAVDPSVSPEGATDTGKPTTRD